MSTIKRTTQEIDTGQTADGKECKPSDDVEMDEKGVELGLNQENKHQNGDRDENTVLEEEMSGIDKQEEQGLEEMKIGEDHETKKDSEMKGFSFEMKFKVDQRQNHYVATSVELVGGLLERWAKSGVIEGVLTNEKTFRKEKLDKDLRNWMIPPKIVHNKSSVTAEIIMMMKTNETALSLYMKEVDYCNNNEIFVTGKNTIMEFTTKIGFLTQTYVKIASPKYYIADLSKKINIEEKIIDVRKAYTYDKGERSKVLVVYATEKEALRINDKLMNAKYNRYKYVSYKGSSSDGRLAAMQTNDMKNIPARYEIMYNASLTEKLTVEGKQVTLEEYLMKLNHANHNYFLAAEQGSGKYENHVTVIINPKKITKAKQWLMNNYPTLNFEEKKDRSSTVKEERYKVNTKYNEELIEFLRPTLESKEAVTNKKYEKKFKTYAQALGIKIYNNNKEKNNKTTSQKRKNVQDNNGEKNNKNNQIAQLMEYIRTLKESIELILKSPEIPQHIKQPIEDNMSKIQLDLHKNTKEGKESEESEEENNVEDAVRNEDEKKVDTTIEVAQVNKQKNKKTKNYENNNRHTNSSNPMGSPGHDNVLAGKYNLYNQWHREQGIQQSQTKRIKVYHGSK